MILTTALVFLYVLVALFIYDAMYDYLQTNPLTWVVPVLWPLVALWVLFSYVATHRWTSKVVLYCYCPTKESTGLQKLISVYTYIITALVILNVIARIIELFN